MRRVLAAVVPQKHFAQRVRLGIYRDSARATTTNWVLRHLINRSVPVSVFVFDLTLGNNWEAQIAKPVVGRWTEVTLNVATFREKRDRRRQIAPGDALDDISIHAGQPGDAVLRLFVDDVALIGRD